MKILFGIVFAAIIALLSSCASVNHHLTLDPVGPLPGQSMGATTSKGTLVVYSGYRVNADFNARDAHRSEFSDYSIYTMDGQLLKRVHNNDGTILQQVVPVSLPAGRYSVIARANGYGLVSVPVVIKSQQSTVICLESGVKWPGDSAISQTNAVCLPDGQVVGWKAD
jgi:hypothetical protein